MKICVCGGGNLGLVCAGFLGAQKGVELSVFTRNPSLWESGLEVVDPNQKVFFATPLVISSEAKDVVFGSDIVLLCLPGFAIESTLNEIKPYVSNNTIVGSIVCSTGFFFAAHRILADNVPLFGFQRVPFIARTIEYGHKANLLGYKAELCIAVEGIENREGFRERIEKLFLTPTRLLNSFYEASLTNSNPILHTGRLYSMWQNWDGEVYRQPVLFYKEWTDEASQLVIDMDAEFMQLVKALGMTRSAIPSLLEYYESTDASSLTRKIRSIPAFESILAPMKEVDNGWIPDFSSRYFTEDFPYGLKIIHDLMISHSLYEENINTVLSWGLKKCECLSK